MQKAREEPAREWDGSGARLNLPKCYASAGIFEAGGLGERKYTVDISSTTSLNNANSEIGAVGYALTASSS